jgi:hypothetical protein
MGVCLRPKRKAYLLQLLRGLRLTPFASGSKVKAFVLCFFFLAVSSSKHMVIAYQALRGVVARN